MKATSTFRNKAELLWSADKWLLWHSISFQQKCFPVDASNGASLSEYLCLWPHDTHVTDGGLLTAIRRCAIVAMSLRFMLHCTPWNPEIVIRALTDTYMSLTNAHWPPVNEAGPFPSAFPLSPSFICRAYRVKLYVVTSISPASNAQGINRRCTKTKSYSGQHLDNKSCGG